MIDAPDHDHIACECFEEWYPPHCQLCSEKAGHLVEWKSLKHADQNESRVKNEQ